MLRLNPLPKSVLHVVTGTTYVSDRHGMDAYVWLLTLFDLEGCEDGEDMLILLTLSVTLMVSTLTCVALTNALRKLRRAPADPDVQ